MSMVKLRSIPCPELSRRVEYFAFGEIEALMFIEIAQKLNTEIREHLFKK
jgi:hypothetical protein